MIKKDDKIRFTMRLSEHIHKRVQEKSAEIGVSKNAFIMYAIDKVLKEGATTEEII